MNKLSGRAIISMAILFLYFSSSQLLGANNSQVQRMLEVNLNDTTDVPEPSTGNKWEYGASIGFQFSTIEGDLTDNHSYIGDFNGGVYGSTQIFPPLGLLIELYYAGLGTGFASIGDSKLRFNYLVLPIMFTYEARPDLFIGIGPYFGFLLSAKDKGDDFEEDITDLISGLDVGAKLGLYFQLSEVIRIGASFNRGFINTQKGERVSNFKQYNQSIMLVTQINLTNLLIR